jgi:hypothetical protein
VQIETFQGFLNEQSIDNNTGIARITVKHVRLTIVAVEKQKVLRILSVRF